MEVAIIITAKGIVDVNTTPTIIRCVNEAFITSLSTDTSLHVSIHAVTNEEA